MPSNCKKLIWARWWSCSKFRLYSDCLRRESNFLASIRQVTALCMRVCCIVCVCDCITGYTQAYTQIMQHTRTHKAVTGRVEAKKLLSRRRQSNYSWHVFIRKEPRFLKHALEAPENTDLCTLEEYEKRYFFPPPSTVTSKMVENIVGIGLLPESHFVKR